jgi:hypothetical protein
MGAAAQRPVDDQQVVGGRVLRPVGQGQLHLGAGEPLLQGERQLVERRPGGEPGRVAHPAGGDADRLGGRGEQAAFDDEVRNPGGAVAGDQPGGEGRGDPGDRLRPGPVHPDSGVDAAHAVREQHHAGRDGGGIGVDGPPLRPRYLQVKVELGAGFLQGAAVQFLAERHPVPGIPRVDGVPDGRWGGH